MYAYMHVFSEVSAGGPSSSNFFEKLGVRSESTHVPTYLSVLNVKSFYFPV